jgi:hypothetical protein
VQVWTVRAVNPDGLRRGSRQNVRGVDLNRNFPHRWRGGGEPFDGYYPGRLRRVGAGGARAHAARAADPPGHLDPLPPGLPDGEPDRRTGPRGGACLRPRVKLPAGTLPRLRGTVTGWQNHNWPGTSAFVVELAAGRLTARGVDRHARAVLAAGADEVARAGGRRHHRGEAPHHLVADPFGADRRRQMRAYTHRHYGLGTVRLREPRVIVQHFTASSSFGPAFNTFRRQPPRRRAARAPRRLHALHRGSRRHHPPARAPALDVPPHDRPQPPLVRIEHVGTSDADVLSRRRQLEASLRLTACCRTATTFRRRTSSATRRASPSPYHSERVAALRRRTHGDFGPATMRAYRARLGALEGG